MKEVKMLIGSDLVELGIYKDSKGFLIVSKSIYETNFNYSIISRVDIDKLKKKLEKIEGELSKCRTTVMEDGWQTMRYAKKARKWDILAQEKMEILRLIDEYEANNTRV